MSPQLAAATPGPCLYLGCDQAATHAHRSKYGQSWHRGCGDHHAGIRDSMWIGQPATGGEVVSVKLSPACAVCAAPDLEACRAGLVRFGWHDYQPKAGADDGDAG